MKLKQGQFQLVLLAVQGFKLQLLLKEVYVFGKESPKMSKSQPKILLLQNLV